MGALVVFVILTPVIVIESPVVTLLACNAKGPPVPVESELVSAWAVVILPPPTEKLFAAAGSIAVTVNVLVRRQKAARRVSAVLRNIACDMNPDAVARRPSFIGTD